MYPLKINKTSFLGFLVWPVYCSDLNALTIFVSKLNFCLWYLDLWMVFNWFLFEEMCVWNVNCKSSLWKRAHGCVGFKENTCNISARTFFAAPKIVTQVFRSWHWNIFLHRQKITLTDINLDFINWHAQNLTVISDW